MDLRLNYDGWLLAGDLALEGGDLATDPTLETAVIVSLFSDRRAAQTDELPSGCTWRRGWWGSQLPEMGGDERQWGSHLWLLSREKQTEETRRRAEQYAREALAWMIEDNVASAVGVRAEWTGMGRLALRVDIHRPDGVSETYSWATIWQATEDHTNAL